MSFPSFSVSRVTRQKLSYGLGYSNYSNFPETREFRARRRYSRDYYPNVSQSDGLAYGYSNWDRY